MQQSNKTVRGNLVNKTKKKKIEKRNLRRKLVSSVETVNERILTAFFVVL